jgi:hypothetical protein
MNNVLYDSLHKFYSENDNMNKFNEYVNGNKKISLRIIDWFVTNYSKKHNIFYETFKTNDDILTLNMTDNLYSQINIFHAYKSQLKSYSKKKFDPFCRRDRIMFECIGHKLETTLGQLNFFKWGIETMLLEYILENYDDIETDMNTCYNASKKNKKDNTRKKRQELSKNHSRGLNLSNHRIRLDFT